MNGVMPGPLWLAIASAINNTSVETGTLTHPSKNATVTEKMTDSQRDVSDLETEWGGRGCESPSATREVKREGG